jgi:hypothetical protein
LDRFSEPMRLPAAELTSYPRLAWKLETFGAKTPLEQIRVTGRYSELLGVRTSAVPMRESDRELTLVSEQLALFADVQPSSGIVPAHFYGEIRGAQADPPVHLAIAVNGTVEVVTRTTSWTSKPHYFAAMIPEAAFKSGRNPVEVFKIDETNGTVALSPITPPMQDQFRLVRDGDGREAISSSSGQVLTLRADAVKGYLDQIQGQGRLYTLSGWAVDAAKLKPAATIVVFSEGKQIYSGRPGTDRPDLVKVFGAANVLESGYRLTIPKRELKNPSSLRIFAISADGLVSELSINEAARNTLESSE